MALLGSAGVPDNSESKFEHKQDKFSKTEQL